MMKHKSILRIENPSGEELSYAFGFNEARAGKKMSKGKLKPHGTLSPAYVKGYKAGKR